MTTKKTNSQNKTYTIKDAAKVSGLAESTLRYYESIGLIDPIERDPSSKHRVYSEADVERIIIIACLSATGMSLDAMSEYMKNRTGSQADALKQVDILARHEQNLQDEITYLQMRQQYVKAKIAYWHAMAANDPKAIEKCSAATYTIADKLNLPRAISRGRRHKPRKLAP